MDNLLPLCSSCHSLARHGSAKIWERNGHIHYRFADGSRYAAYNRAHPVRERQIRTRFSATRAQHAMAQI